MEVAKTTCAVCKEESLKNIIDGKGNDAKRCPVCSNGDVLMDI